MPPSRMEGAWPVLAEATVSTVSQDSIAIASRTRISTMGREPIKVQIRPVPDDQQERVISFPYPENIPTSEWTKMGIPIASHQVTYVVGRNVQGKFHYPNFQSHRWMTFDWDTDLEQAQAAAESSLMEFLGSHGYEVELV